MRGGGAPAWPSNGERATSTTTQHPPDSQPPPAYLASVVPLVREGKAVPLMSFGQVNEAGELIRDPALPELPTVGEVYEQLYGKKPAGPPPGAPTTPPPSHPPP